jgi:Cys/Met metabolism PLP-dependent enzyme
VRLSVGIEDVEDLWADLAESLEALSRQVVAESVDTPRQHVEEGPAEQRR